MELRTAQRALGPARSLRALEGGRLGDRDAVVATAYGHRDFWTRRLLAAADALAFVLALLASEPFGKDINLGLHLTWGVLALPGWIVLFKVYGLYDRDAKRVSHSTLDDLPW